MGKLTSMFVTMVIILMLPNPMQALATGGGSITIKNNINESGISIIGNTYEVYRINNIDIDELKAYLSGALNIKPIRSEIATDEIVTINNLPLGYYVVLEKGTDSTNEYGELIASINLSMDNYEFVIKLKNSALAISNSIYYRQIKGVDNIKNDLLSFRLIAKIPSNITDYKNYKYIIHDTMTKGLTFQEESLKLYVQLLGEKKYKLKEEYYDLEVLAEDNHTFDLSIDVKRAITDYVEDVAAGVEPSKRRGFPAGVVIVAVYDAKLNTDIEIAPKPNINKVYLEYSNNPNDVNSTATTSDAVVKDYTFAFKALKVGEDGEGPLAGSELKLEVNEESQKETIYYKKMGEDKDGNPMYYTEEADGINVYYVCGKDHEHIEDFDKIITNDSGKFKVVGLDDSALYTLTEIKSPDGYRKINPIDFRFDVEYDRNKDVVDVNVISDGKVIGMDEVIINTTVDNFKDINLFGIGDSRYTILIGASVLLIILGIIYFYNK